MASIATDSETKEAPTTTFSSDAENALPFITLDPDTNKFEMHDEAVQVLNSLKCPVAVVTVAVHRVVSACIAPAVIRGVRVGCTFCARGRGIMMSQAVFTEVSGLVRLSRDRLKVR